MYAIRSYLEYAWEQRTVYVIIDDKTDECGEEKETCQKKFTVQYCISLRQYSSNTSQTQTPEIPYYCQQ